MVPPKEPTSFNAMAQRRFIPSDITASVVVHVALLTLLVLFTEVHPFGAVTAEQIPVEIVTPQEVPETPAPVEQEVAEAKPEPAAAPAPETPAADKPEAASEPAPAAPQQQQAALAPQPQPPTPQPPAPAPPQAAPSPPQPTAPAYKPPEPDISVKYQVLLGLPPELPPISPPGRDKGPDNFDAAATEAADVSNAVAAEFRRHLKTCSKLPATLSRTDDVRVKLRVMLTPQGRLAAEPVLIEASASAKGPLLMQGAIRALSACQPYAMLPADRYGEWKVLDLGFTPQDFTGG